MDRDQIPVSELRFNSFCLEQGRDEPSSLFGAVLLKLFYPALTRVVSSGTHKLFLIVLHTKSSLVCHHYQANINITSIALCSVPAFRLSTELVAINQAAGSLVKL